ncbi:MAG: DUF4175 domain-containing protein [Bacteroidetes bacterium]|nr:DUF4175 domain-containing protein [Bacteroidota bacterium]
MNDNYQILIDRLDAFIRKYYKNQLVRGGIYAFTLSLAFYLLVVTFEYFGHFNTGVRTFMFYTFIIGIGFIVSRFVIIPLMHLYRLGKIISHEQAAEIIGKHFSKVQDKLLNVLQLKKQADENTSTHPELLLAGINQKIDELKPVPFISAINLNENRKYLRFAVIPLFALIVILFAAPSLVKDSTKRLIEHQTFFEKPAPFTFEVLNKSLRALQQQDFQIDIRINGNEIPAEAFVEIDGNQFRLEKENLTTFHYLFKNLQRTQSFKLFADGFYSTEYTIEALPNPLLMGFTINLEYPVYLNKQNEAIQNTGDLVIPAGTKVKWNFNTKNTEQLNLVFHPDSYRDSIIKLTPNGDDQFSYSHRFTKNDSYVVTTSNHFIHSKDSIHYTISVVPDIYPSITIEQSKDSLSGKRTFFRGMIKDDYGFSKLSFNYRFLKSNDSLQSNQGKQFTDIIPVSKSVSTDQFFYSWDLESVSIVAGDEIEYYFEISDNDGISGPKSTRSQSQIFKAPTLKEIAENTEKNNESIKDDLKESIAKAKQIQKDLNDLGKKMLDKKELSYEDKKKAEELLNRQKELEKKLDEIRKNNENKNRQEEEYKRVNEDIAQKQEQLQSILDKLKSPELQKLLEQLQQLMQNVNKDQLQEQLSQMKLDNKDLQKELERSIELFKQMEFEQKLQDNIDKLNELAKKQDELAKNNQDSQDSKDKKDSKDDKDQKDGKDSKESKDAKEKDLKDQQDKLNKDFEDFRKDMDDLAKKNEELEEKKDLDNTEKEEQDIQKDMEESSEQLEQKKSGKASKSQKNASQKMQQLAQKMSKMKEEMEQEENEEDMDAMRALLENLLRLSFNQEQLMQQLKTIDINNPQYLKLSQQQQKLKDDAKSIEDSLFALSKRVVEIAPKVNQEITAINQNMEESLDNLEARMVPQARSRQQFVMTSVNNLTLLLSEALQQMQQQQAQSMSQSSCKKPGKKKSSSMAELRKMQEELNKNMKKMKEGMKPGQTPKPGKQGKDGQQMSQELAKMAAQQEFIRNELNKLNQSENKDGKKTLGNLEDIANQMEQTEKDIVNRMISEQTLKRQQEITTRLLESEKAEREREQDEQRKSEEAKNAFHRNPSEFEEYKRMKLKEMELLKTVPPSLNSYYKQKVNDYFQSIDK